MFLFIFSAVLKVIRKKQLWFLVFMVWGRGGSAAPAEEVVDGCHTKSNLMLSNPGFPWEKRTCCSNIWESSLKSSSKYSTHSYGIKGKILWLTVRTESAQMMFLPCLNLQEKFKAYQKFSWFPWKQDFNLWIKTAQGPKMPNTNYKNIFLHWDSQNNMQIAKQNRNNEFTRD